MLRLVLRQLALEPGRTLLTAAAVAAVVAVILILEGFNQGLLRQLSLVALDRDADLIVSQAGVSNMIAARSTLPQFARGDVEAVAGVEAAHPLTGIPLIYRSRGRHTPIFLWVYDTAGGPVQVAEGHEPSGPRELAVDRSLAVKHGLASGDPAVLSGFEFRVSGITEDAAALFTAFAFARYDDLIDFYFESDAAADITSFPLLSFLLVELEPWAEPAAVAADITAALPSGDVHVPEALAVHDVSLGRLLFGPILGLLIAVAYAIGLLVMAIILFAAVNSRRRQLGVLKAMGFSNAYLGTAVVLEALLLALVAVPAGMLLASVAATVIEGLAPLYRILPLEPAPLLRTAVACAGFSMLGALLPVRLIARLDPGVVFQGA